MTTAQDIESLAALLGSVRFNFDTEEDLQKALAVFFTERGISFEREVILGPGERIDFLIDGELGLEVKTKGGRSDLLRQLFRYAEHSKIRGLVVVSTRAVHRTLGADSISGKPIHVVFLSRWP